jgi:alpha-N-arabinofuranosidase
MEKQIMETLAVCDLVQGHRRSSKQLWLSFDEWNVWYRARSGDTLRGHGEEAPHLLEEPYNLEDGLLVGGFLNTLMRHADRIKIACLAQLVNVIAPIMTNSTGMFRHSIYYPYLWALQYARGSVLNVLVEAPTYEVNGMGQVSYIDAVATTENGKTAVFVLNRDLSKSHTVEINWQDRAPGKVLVANILTGNDLKAVNSFESPNKVAPQAFDKPTTSGGKTKFEVPPRSYTVIQWSA